MHCEASGPIHVQHSGHRVDSLPSLLGIATHAAVRVPGMPSLALVRGDALEAHVEVCTDAGFAGLGNGQALPFPTLVSLAAQPCSFRRP